MLKDTGNTYDAVVCLPPPLGDVKACRKCCAGAAMGIKENPREKKFDNGIRRFS
ncbi:hypothetical protein [Alteromonas antoniana]|uniref:hypothetical protein n=1 Tax=Alteromonas antoniana TaxID=2803813 RepID=UPI001C451116|nr:hypothetical protein [Alteromonas antoniana]